MSKYGKGNHKTSQSSTFDVLELESHAVNDLQINGLYILLLLKITLVYR